MISETCVSTNPALSASNFLRLVRSLTLPQLTDCGSVTGGASCTNPSHASKRNVIVFTKKCKRLSCEVCGRSRATEQGRRAADRFTGLTRLYRKRGAIGNAKLKHISWSVDPELWPQSEVEADHGKAIRDEFDRARKETVHGFNGGLSIFHGWRKKHDDGTPCEEKSVWKDGKRVEGCQRHHVWQWGPHFHYLGFGWFDDSPQVQHVTGWTYHIIPDEGPRDVFSTVQYLLTHAGIWVKESGKQSGQAVRWLGAYSNGKGGKKRVDVIEEPVTCRVPGCDLTMHKYGPSSTEPDGLNRSYDQGEFIVKHPIFKWHLKHKQKTFKQQPIDDSRPASASSRGPPPGLIPITEQPPLRERKRQSGGVSSPEVSVLLSEMEAVRSPMPEGPGAMCRILTAAYQAPGMVVPTGEYRNGFPQDVVVCMICGRVHRG